MQAVITDCPDGTGWDGMGWPSDWAGAGAGTETGAGLERVQGGGGHQTRVRKKSRKQTERRVGLTGGTGEVGDEKRPVNYIDRQLA